MNAPTPDHGTPPARCGKCQVIPDIYCPDCPTPQATVVHSTCDECDHGSLSVTDYDDLSNDEVQTEYCPNCDGTGLVDNGEPADSDTIFDACAECLPTPDHGNPVTLAGIIGGVIVDAVHWRDVQADQYTIERPDGAMYVLTSYRDASRQESFLPLGDPSVPKIGGDR